MASTDASPHSAGGSDSVDDNRDTGSNTGSAPSPALIKDQAGRDTTVPPPSQGTKRNAFTELMSPRPKAAAAAATLNSTQRAFYGRVAQSSNNNSPTASAPSPSSFVGRDGLGAYTADPAAFPASRVIHHDDRFVFIHDMYPKSAVHALLLPRPAAFTTTASSPAGGDDARGALLRMHPFDALDGVRHPGLLAAVQAEAARLRRLVAKELQRRYGRFSAQDAAREAVLDGHAPGDDLSAASASDGPVPPLPPGRDWEAEVLVGVHAHPSMNDLHVHVLSRDMSSAAVRHRRHYNSFTTPFLVDVADLPLAPDDPRRQPGRSGGGQAYLDRDLVCWRCGRNFGNRFKQLKEHLALEFEEWKRE